MDVVEARRLYGLAAAQGDAGAQLGLGVMNFRGDGGPVDVAEARRFYGLAAAQGHANAQFYLGGMHYRGEGGPVDLAEARRLYGRAAAQDDAGAQLGLGVMNFRGDGGPVDLAEARRLYGLAAVFLSSLPCQFSRPDVEKPASVVAGKAGREEGEGVSEGDEGCVRHRANIFGAPAAREVFMTIVQRGVGGFIDRRVSRPVSSVRTWFQTCFGPVLRHLVLFALLAPSFAPSLSTASLTYDRLARASELVRS